MSHVALNNEVGILKDGFYQLAKDKEALEVFLAEVKTKQLEFASILDKIKYLIEHNYYYNVFGEYTEEEVQRIYEAAYTHKFEFNPIWLLQSSIRTTHYVQTIRKST